MRGVQPTCFYDTWKRVDDPTKDDKIVHGYVTAGHPRRRIMHAWVEMEDIVWDPQFDIEMDKDVYYELMDAEPKKKYTAEEGMINAVRKGHTGPWEDL